MKPVSNNQREVNRRTLNVWRMLRCTYCSCRRLAGRLEHAREFTWHKDGIMAAARDEIKSGWPMQVVSQIHLHPDCQVLKAESDSVELTPLVGAFAVRFVGLGKLHVEDCWYCPEFGRRILAKQVASRTVGAEVRFEFCLVPRAHSQASDLEFRASSFGL